MHNQYTILNDFCISLGQEYEGFRISSVRIFRFVISKLKFDSFSISKEWFLNYGSSEASNLITELKRRQGLAAILCTLHRLLGGSAYIKCDHILPSTRIAGNLPFILNAVIYHK